MAKIKEVPSAEFTRNFGRYRMLAQRGAVGVTSHGRITGYFVSPDDFEAFERFRAWRRSFATAELPDEKVEAIMSTRMDARHHGLNALLDPE
jgi:hypothetical protein